VTFRRTACLLLIACAAAALACAGRCSEPPESSCVVTGVDPAPAHWAAVCAAFDAIAEPEDVSLQVGDADGVLLTYTRGETSPETFHDIASASKWMASAAILRLVERGELSLDDHPQRYIDWWTDDPGDPRSQVTLAHLLAFTSGFGASAAAVRCANRARQTLGECAREMYDDGYAHDAPGETYHYGPIHMHVAALMAEGATGKSWSAIFADEVVAPLGLHPDTAYTKAGPNHPRIAGGIATTGDSYATFVRAQLAGSYLSGSLDALAADRTPSGDVQIAFSPLTAADLEWHYGFGVWRECPAPEWEGACDEHVRISSPGAFGFYPWLDRRHAYWAVMSARRGLFAGAAEDSVRAGLVLQPLIVQALERDRQ